MSHKTRVLNCHYVRIGTYMQYAICNIVHKVLTSTSTYCWCTNDADPRPKQPQWLDSTLVRSRTPFTWSRQRPRTTKEHGDISWSPGSVQQNTWPHVPLLFRNVPTLITDTIDPKHWVQAEPPHIVDREESKTQRPDCIKRPLWLAIYALLNWSDSPNNNHVSERKI